MEATSLYGHSMFQMLSDDEIEKWHGNPDIYIDELEEISNTPDDNDVGYFVEVDLSYPDILKEKTKRFSFCLESKKINHDKYNDYMKKTKPENYTTFKKLICDRSDKKKYLIPYRMLQFYVKHGMVVEKIHEIVSFKQSKWLEKHMSFNTQKRNRAKNDFGKDFFILLVNTASGDFLENVRNRLRLEMKEKMILKILLNNNQI